MTRLHQKRFDELLVQADEIAATQQTKHSEHSSPYKEVDEGRLLAWTVKVKNLLSNACGSESEHYRAFAAADKPQSYEDNVARFVRVRSVFLAAKEDFEGGYLSSVRTLVQAEVFSTELDQGRELLSAGYASAAAVIAGVVLETNLRELCTRHGLAAEKLERMNADLVKAGVYNVLVQKKITALAAIRNSAAHGKNGEFSHSDVAAMLADVERLLEEWLR
jgi:hypothetical protein